MNPAEARRRFAAARVAVLATVGEAGAPHLVPVTFVVDGASGWDAKAGGGATVWTAVDGKPKQGRTWLRRHENIRSRPEVSLLVQYWDEDWSRLWWVRADGLARVTAEPSTVERVVALLRREYDQYATVGVGGPVIEVAVHTWRGWAAAEQPAG